MLLLLLPNRSRITYKMLTMIPLYRGISIKSLNETMYEIYLNKITDWVVFDYKLCTVHSPTNAFL